MSTSAGAGAGDACQPRAARSAAAHGPHALTAGCGATAPWLLGVDFSSAPTPRKPITLARGRRCGDALGLERVDACASLSEFAARLLDPGPWLGAFDLPFGLPRELVHTLQWPSAWAALMQHYRALGRDVVRARFKAFCAARPAGAKFARRACEGPAGSSPAMKWVNPPVALMLHAGAPLLLDAGVHLPGLHDGDRRRVALEGYPGLLARELIGARSYKADARARQTDARRVARVDLVDALQRGRTRLGLRLCLSPAQRAELIDDASGDRLDAVLCLMQAAWAEGRPHWGLPAQVDPLEGWIVTA